MAYKFLRILQYFNRCLWPQHMLYYIYIGNGMLGVTDVHEFPEEYPNDLLDRILTKGGAFVAYEAYRSAAYGVNDLKSYLSTFQQNASQKRPKIPKKKKDDDIGDYSTSFFLEPKKLKNVHEMSMREHPQAIIIKGTTCPALGPTRLNSKSGHVDWWLYKNTQPWVFFSIVEVNL